MLAHQVTKLTNFDVADFARKLLNHIVLETDLCNDNYFYYAYLMGRFSTTNCPRYLTADGFARAQSILQERPECVQLRQVRVLFNRYVMSQSVLTVFECA